MKASYATLKGEHAGLLHCIEAAVSEDPWSELSFRTHLDSRSTLTIGALIDEEIAGFVACQLIGDAEADILQVAVARRFQRQGVANGLINELKSQGLETITLEVRTSNVPAIALYKRHGFQVVGKRPRFYSDGAEALTMRWKKSNEI